MDDRPTTQTQADLIAHIRVLDPAASSLAHHQYLSARALLVAYRIERRLRDGEGGDTPLNQMIDEERAAVSSHIRSGMVERARRGTRRP